MLCPAETGKCQLFSVEEQFPTQKECVIAGHTVAMGLSEQNKLSGNGLYGIQCTRQVVAQKDTCPEHKCAFEGV